MGVRKYQAGDETHINRLFQKVFRQGRTEEDWLWKYSQTPEHMKPLIFVYEEEGSIVGHVAIWTLPAHIKGRERLIGLRVDTMVEPSYQRQGIFRQLHQHMMEQAKQHHIVCLIGFPSKVAKKGLTHTDKVKTIGKVERYIKINKPIAFSKHALFRRLSNERIKEQEITSFPRKLAEGWELEQLNGFHEEFIQFIQMKSNWKSVQTKKCQQFLRWKFTNRPDKKYTTFVLTYDGDIKGYVIVNCYHKGNVKVGAIVDIMAIDEPTAWQYLLEAATKCLQHTDFIQLWICPDRNIKSYLKKQQFIKTDKPLSLVVNALDASVEDIPLNEWWLTMGDIDAY